MADMYRPMAAGTHLVIMLTDHLPLSGTVIWTHGETMGVRFDKEIDVAGLLAELAPGPHERRVRLPRFDIDAWARLRVGARVFSVRLRNISQGGARMRIHGLNSSGGAAVLSLNGFRAVESVVRWCHGSQAGISFNQPLGLREQMRWLHSIGATPTSRPADR
jgi:PilZ domain